MNKCPKCKRNDLEYLGNGEFLCPWTDCKWKGNREIKIYNYPAIIKSKFHFLNRPRLSVIIPYAHSQDIQRTNALYLLINNLTNQTMKSYEIVVVEYIKEGQEPRFPYLDKIDKYIVLKDNRHLNKAWLMNIGAREANSENLIFHDADVLIRSNFLETVWECSHHWQFFTCWSSFRCMPGKDNPYTRIHNSETVRCMIGSFYSERDFFFNQLGGFNENYFGYGREDTDLWHRVNYIFKGKIPIMKYDVIHYYHHWHQPNGANPLDRDDISGNAMLEYTMKYPKRVIEILKNTNLGRMESPTIIEY